MPKIKGATSNVRVSLMELNRVLKENATVIVNRPYAEALKLACQPFKATRDAIKRTVQRGVETPEEPSMAIGIQVENYED
jgi:hypothetical protein|tara:strand:+ start:239 stop:478 length:240 start_codon:yes stop_codon:yes gene_type:complete